MADTAQEQASEGDVDHCFGDVDADLVVAHEPAPTEHSGGSAFNYPSLGQDIKALLASETPHDVDKKVEEDDLVLELSAVIGAVDEEMHYPIFRPSNRSDSAWFSSRSRPYDAASLASTWPAWITKPRQRESFFKLSLACCGHGSTIRCPDATLTA
jgi:hypothetical protein